MNTPYTFDWEHGETPDTQHTPRDYFVAGKLFWSTKALVSVALDTADGT
jgi:hypothetical protein